MGQEKVNMELYMNKPLPPVEVGGVYYNNVDMCDNPFVVLEIIILNDNFYARCSHIDEFTGEEEELTVYANYLSKEKE